jgi:hypothetical protein
MTSDGSETGSGGGTGNGRSSLHGIPAELLRRLPEQDGERVKKVVRLSLERRNGGFNGVNTRIRLADIKM